MENINVFIRLKPTPPSSHDTNFTITTPTTLYNTKTKETFTFDHIIPQTTSNEAIFTSLIKDTLSFLLNGINVSIFAYGQTSTGKTYTMKGDNINNGIIPLSIKNIFTRLQEASIIKHSIKVSYAEIYNETVNDLLNTSKRNLEIRESVAKGVFVNNLTEIVVDDYDKVIKILNTGESNRKIAETKLNEKSSRSHTIFKIYIEFNRKDITTATTTTTESNVVKTYSAQLNLIDLAGSENVSKAKCEGIRLKEGTNINKSLLALSNVINRLSQNSKHFINYRDSKLTRLLQTSLGGNSKTTIICTIVDDNVHYSETVNTLHFGLKAKNVKTTVRINEVIDDKGKIILENNQLKSKIKMLQELINEKKEKRNKCIINKSNSSNNNITTVNKVYSSNCKISSKNLSSLLCTADKRSNNVLNTSIDGNEQINALEKEVALLKRLLINNKEEVGEDVLNNSVNNDLYSINSNNNVYHSLTQSAYKTSSNTYNNNNRLTNINQFQESSAMKSPFNPYLPLYPNDNNNTLQEPPSSAYRRTCMTELRGYTQYNYANTSNTNNNNNINTNAYFQNSSLHKTASKIYANNALCLSAFHNSTINNNNQNEFEYHSTTGMNNDLFKENEDLRRSLYEMRKTYYEVVQSKENQIKLLNQNHSMTLENCEKLIKEAEDNFLNLKLNYDQAQEQLKLKDNEISELNNKNMNLESMVNYYKDELAKLKEFNVDEDIERKYNELNGENEKLKEELSLIKSTLQLKENECVNMKEQLQSLNVDIIKLKTEIKTLKTNKGINDSNKLLIDYENKVTQLEKENNEYKNSLQLIKETQIVEYQKLLDESFDKIRELNNELYESKEKINFLEKAFAIIESTNVSANTNASSKDISICEFKHPNNDKEDIQYTPQHNSNNNESNGVSGSNKSTNSKLLSKKRKILPKIYHGIIDKQHSSKTPKQLSNISSTKENINVANITNTTTTSSTNEISNFQI